MEQNRPLSEKQLLAEIVHFEQEAARLDAFVTVRASGMRTVYLAIALRKKRALSALREVTKTGRSGSHSPAMHG